MAKSEPVVIIEDDIDNQDIVTEVKKDMGVENEVFFSHPSVALKIMLGYCKSSQHVNADF